MLIGYLPVSATDTTSSAQNPEIGADEKKVNLKDRKDKKKKGKGKILIPPNDEDIILTLDEDEQN